MVLGHMKNMPGLNLYFYIYKIWHVFHNDYIYYLYCRIKIMPTVIYSQLFICLFTDSLLRHLAPMRPASPFHTNLF